MRTVSAQQALSDVASLLSKIYLLQTHAETAKTLTREIEAKLKKVWSELVQPVAEELMRVLVCSLFNSVKKMRVSLYRKIKTLPSEADAYCADKVVRKAFRRVKKDTLDFLSDCFYSMREKGRILENVFSAVTKNAAFQTIDSKTLHDGMFFMLLFKDPLIHEVVTHEDEASSKAFAFRSGFAEFEERIVDWLFLLTKVDSIFIPVDVERPPETTFRSLCLKELARIRNAQPKSRESYLDASSGEEEDDEEEGEVEEDKEDESSSDEAEELRVLSKMGPYLGEALQADIQQD